MGITFLRRKAGAIFAAVLTLCMILPCLALSDTAEDWFAEIYDEYINSHTEELLPTPTAGPARTAGPSSNSSKILVDARVMNRVVATGEALSDEGLEFVVSAQSGYAVLTGYTGDAKRVSIPSSVMGFTVAYIGDGALGYQYGITVLALPDSLVQLGNGVFFACVNLEEVTLPAGITDVGVSLFTYCKALKNVTLPPTLPIIRGGMFQQCDSLENLVIPDGVTMIEELAFHHCVSLREVSVPLTITTIADDAFSSCPQVTLLVKDGSYAQAYAHPMGISSKVIR